MRQYTPKEAAQRLCRVGRELCLYDIPAEDIEALQQAGERFQLHLARLESFRSKLKRWAEQFPC